MPCTRTGFPWRRSLGVGLTLVAAMLWLGLAASSRLHGSVLAQEVLPQIVVEYDLTAAPLKWEIQPGLVVDGWGYNGQVPGPEIRVREGDLVRVRLHNRLPVPTTLHWHGIDVPMSMDGVPGLTQDAVEPGADFTYEFTATNPGTRWYHSHVASNVQMELGLYGAMIIEPSIPEETQYTRDFTYLLDERALDVTPDVALGNAEVQNRATGNGRGGLFDYDLFLMNGKAGDAIPPFQIAEGERIRLRLINAGNLPHAMHLHGQSFTIIATDGNPVPAAARLVKDTILIGPGERYDVEILGTNPGIWMFHCHMPNHSDNGMMTTMVYDGFDASAMSHHDPPPATPAPDLATSAPTASTGEGGGALPTSAPAPSQAVAVPMLDDRYGSPTIQVPVGATVTWTNRGNNLHTTTAFDGSFDSGTLVAEGSFSYTFTRTGEFRYYCRQHLLGGMLGTIKVG